MKTHPLNVSYLVVGLVCLGISGSWALRAADVVDTVQIGWLLPLTLVVAGSIGLIATSTRAVSRRRSQRESQQQSEGFAEDEDDTTPFTHLYDDSNGESS